MIKIGDKAIESIYLSDNMGGGDITSVYLGDLKIWPTNNKIFIISDSSVVPGNISPIDVAKTITIVSTTNWYIEIQKSTIIADITPDAGYAGNTIVNIYCNTNPFTIERNDAIYVRSSDDPNVLAIFKLVQSAS